MTAVMNDIVTQHWTAPDGVKLAWHELGSGRPVLLIHGLFSNAQTNWIKYGHAARLADVDFRVIMPDLRAHGQSAAPHDPASYPRDILTQDIAGLITHLALTDFDLAGYSLGARTALRLLAKGVSPRRTILCGMGISGMTEAAIRNDFFLGVLDHLGQHAKGSAEYAAETFLRQSGGDPLALRPLLHSLQSVDRSAFAEIRSAILVLIGVDDQDSGSARELAKLLPNAQYQEIPGNHMSAVAKPDLGRAICDYLLRAQDSHAQ
jgi:pimeloyl-ACP methyl ester carboxylesterase